MVVSVVVISDGFEEVRDDNGSSSVDGDSDVVVKTSAGFEEIRNGGGIDGSSNVGGEVSAGFEEDKVVVLMVVSMEEDWGLGAKWQRWGKEEDWLSGFGWGWGEL